jgi:hypothetical protein
MSDEVIWAASDERQVTGLEFERAGRTVNPQPGVALDHGVNGELNRARQSKPPRGNGDRSREYAA